mgnify:CR=1 FL=1
MLNQFSPVKLQKVGFEHRVDTRLIADLLMVQHKNASALIAKYQPDLEEFGFIAFQTRKIKKERAIKFALLTRRGQSAEAVLIIAVAMALAQLKGAA